MVNLKIVFWSCIGTSQETGDRADQAKGLYWKKMECLES